MTQLSNVPMQPNPSAVERPQTLIEKLEQERGYYLQEYQSCLDSHDVVNAIDSCIDIVEAHQSWRKIPSDEKPQDMQAYNLLLKTDSTEYPTLYSVGLFRQYASGHVWLSLVEAETYIDESKILAWQPMNMPSAEFFESLKQPPIEAQDD